MGSSHAFLQLRDLHVSFGGARVLHGVSMSLEEGGIICLIGANGAGKTTTLRTISGLKRADYGEIKFMEQDITGIPPQEILGRGIAHVPQEGRVFGDMTVYQNLAMGAFLRKDSEGIREDLELVFDYFPILRERAKQRAGKLSGGERQMLAIGRALMSKPRVLMMDEPTSGLAPMVVEMVGEIIRRLNHDGISIVLVEQNAEMAFTVARYGYVMERGKITLEGKTEDLRVDDTVRQAYLGL